MSSAIEGERAAQSADPWLHVLRPEDLSLSLALTQTADGDDAVIGLQYSSIKAKGPDLPPHCVGNVLNAFQIGR